MENKDIRDKARVEDIRFWQIAKELGITASYFSVLMRSELSAEWRLKIGTAIDAIALRRG